MIVSELSSSFCLDNPRLAQKVQDLKNLKQKIIEYKFVI